MVQPSENKSAWWIKDSYSEEEIGDLVKWGLDHFWMQNHQMADLVTPDGYNIMTRGEGNYVDDIVDILDQSLTEIEREFPPE